MKFARRTLALCLAVLVMAPSANAQSSVITRSALDQAVKERVARDQADRDAVRALLQRQDVRAIAGKAGVSLDRALTAVSTLSGDDLRSIADQSRQVENQLAGGASNIVISTTTVIIILLLVILIIAIAD
jgi:hypothetical protein